MVKYFALRQSVEPCLPSSSERSSSMSKNLYLKSCLHPRHALYPFYQTTSFSRRSARLRFAGRWMFSRFQRTRDHPLTRCLQSLSDTGSDRCDFEINTGCRFLQMQILCDKSQRKKSSEPQFRGSDVDAWREEELQQPLLALVGPTPNVHCYYKNSKRNK